MWLDLHRAANWFFVIPEEIVQSEHEPTEHDQEDDDEFANVLDETSREMQRRSSPNTDRHHSAERDLQRSEMLKCRQEETDARKAKDVGNGEETFSDIHRVQRDPIVPI